MGGGLVRVFETTIGGDSIEDGNLAGEFTATGTEGVGGGVNVSAESGDSRFFMIGGTIGFNTAKIRGGGIHADVSGNVVRLQGNAVVADNRALVEDGGGVFNAGAHFELRDTIFSENTARNGAGLFLDDGTSDSGTANLTRVTIERNEARRTGGGIFNRGFMNLNQSTLTDNLATFFPDIFDQS